MVSDRTKKIAELNDQLRSRVGIPVFGECVPGAVYMTLGIQSLSPETQIEVWAKVNQFNQFTEDNDPYGERNFGSFDTECGHKIFWKIDYYEDKECVYGSTNPSDPEKSFRILTIMLAQEY